MSRETPETVWRWVPLKVQQVKGAHALVGDDVAHVSSVALTEELAGDVSAGDDVWGCGTPSGPEVYDLAVDGKPAKTERLEKHAFPRIIATYRQLGYELGQA
jgi:hypothetical protein